MPTSIDVTNYVAGDSITLNFTVEQADGSVFPSLSTCQQIAWKLDQASPFGIGVNLLTKTLTHGVVLVDAPTGAVSVSIGPTDVPWTGAMTHSLVVTTASGDVYTVAKGEFVAQATP